MTISKFYSYSLILSFAQTMASASLTLSVSDHRSDKDIMIIFTFEKISTFQPMTKKDLTSTKIKNQYGILSAI